MNRVDFFYGQLVTQGDLDEAFDYVENAALAHRVDTGLLGIVSGLTVTQQGVPNMTVNVAAGTAYDADGNRIFIGGTQVVNLASAAPVGVGASRVASICVRFDRALSDPRVDGNSVTIQYQRAESYEIYLVTGAEVVGVPSAPAKPSDGLVLADVTLTQGDTTIVTADIDMTTTGRRDWAFDIAVGSLPVLQVGTLTEVVTSNRQILNDHISDLSTPHAASSIAFTDPGSGHAATSVQEILDELISGNTATPFELSNNGGYRFSAGDVLFESGVEFGGGQNVVFSGISQFDDELSILGDLYIETQLVQLRASGQSSYRTEVYQFARVAQTTGSGAAATISIADNRAGTARIVFTGANDSNASQCYSLVHTTLFYRNGGSVTVQNMADLTQQLDATAGALACGVTGTASALSLNYVVGSGTWNISIYVEITFAPE